MPLNPEALPDHLIQSAQTVQARFPSSVTVGIVLGSGLGGFADLLPNPTRIPYGDIPHFPSMPAKGHVAGHHGILVLSELSPGFSIACLQGRYHFYEGYDLATVVYPVRLLRQLGVSVLVVTNAAGGIREDFAPGDLMLITDHLNLMGDNPLRGENIAVLGPRFPDMTRAYDPTLGEMTMTAAGALNIPLTLGIYAALPGPSYETPAEIRMLRTLGADAVGMSTVPEVIAANHMGMKVLGISCITNAAAGLSGEKLSHDEVLDTGNRTAEKLAALLNAVLKTLSQIPQQSSSTDCRV